MKKLVLASGNAGKLREFGQLLAPFDFEVLPQSAFDVPEADEPHVTFVENAIAKARHAARLTGLPALADDSGLCVTALGGAPGVFSARYGGEPKSDARNNARLLADLAGQAEIIAADLEDGQPWPLAGRQFDAVVVVNYLFRPLFPALLDAVAPGGVLIYETYAAGNERYGRPRNPEHLLRPGELLSLVANRLQVAVYEAGTDYRPAGPRVLQRICAVAGEAPADLP